MPKDGMRSTTEAPEWCLDPRPWFPCPECGEGLFWEDLQHGVQLICANYQCSSAGMSLPVWRAQQHREDLGLDAPVSEAGWPRPALEGLPVPYITPVTSGRPWWGLTHGARVVRCQNQWCCQVCGFGLPPRAWVLVNTFGDVLSSSAMHEKCLQMSTSTCPHLLGPGSRLRQAEVERSDILGDGEPLSERGALTREHWTVPTLNTSTSISTP